LGDESRQLLTQIGVGRIEAPGMTAGNDKSLFGCESKASLKSRDIFDRIKHRLLAEHVFVDRDGLLQLFQMEMIGSGNQNRIDVSQQLLVVWSQKTGKTSRSKGVSRGVAGVAKSGKLDSFDRLQ
jgi:hypothetical protein